MKSPELHNDGSDKDWYFFVEPKHTGDLIAFLRKHLDGFSADVGGIIVNYSKDTDVFSIPRSISREAIGGTLAKSYDDHSA